MIQHKSKQSSKIDKNVTNIDEMKTRKLRDVDQGNGQITSG